MITVYIREGVKPLPLSLRGRKSFTTTESSISESGIYSEDLKFFFPWSSIAFFEWRD